MTDEKEITWKDIERPVGKVDLMLVGFVTDENGQEHTLMDFTIASGGTASKGGVDADITSILGGGAVVYLRPCGRESEGITFRIGPEAIVTAAFAAWERLGRPKSREAAEKACKQLSTVNFVNAHDQEVGRRVLAALDALLSAGCSVSIVQPPGQSAMVTTSARSGTTITRQDDILTALESTADAVARAQKGEH